MGVPGHPPPLSCSTAVEPQSEACSGRTHARVAALDLRAAVQLVEEAREDLACDIVRADVRQVELTWHLRAADGAEVRQFFG